MARNITRVRVEASRFGYRDRDQAFKMLLHAFKRQRNDVGIDHDLKEHEYFESKSRKNRRKKRSAILKAQQEELQQKFLRGERVKGGKAKMAMEKAAKLLKNSYEKNFDY